MSIRYISTLVFFAGTLVSGCASTRQIAIDPPEIKPHPFQPLQGFSVIDGDDYYVRLISEFDSKADNALKGGCVDIAPSYSKGDQSAALIFYVRNNVLKFNSEAAGFLYQARSGKCNFKFDAKKQYLTPWIRLDSGKETMIDYDFHTNANNDMDFSRLAGDVNTAGNLLALTGVGMGVAVMGQFAGEWIRNSQQAAPAVVQAAPAASPASAKHSSESHSLPAATAFSGKTGTLNHSLFKVYEVAEGGVNPFGSDVKPLGELKIYPEILPALLLKMTVDGIPDARDLSLEEMWYSPIKSTTGDITLQQMIEQSQHPAKPNLNPDWDNYVDVESNCRKLKLVMKELGFNKFDRNAVLYYFLNKNGDWKNYNISRQMAMADDIRPKDLKMYRNKGFGNCLADDDYTVMKTMGLSVNAPSDWEMIGETRQKKERVFSALQSIERQLFSVLKNPNPAEMARQIFPLLTTEKKGDGTVLLQNHLGDLGLEALLSQSVASASPSPGTSGGPAVLPESSAPMVIPGEGVVVDARQLAQFMSGLSISELSCARPAPGPQGKSGGEVGIFLFATKEGSPRAKGGAMEFEFSGGKINRIALQLPTVRDFEQDVLDHPEIGGCRIDAAFLNKLR
jgi:hypothetical protein